MRTVCWLACLVGLCLRVIWLVELCLKAACGLGTHGRTLLCWGLHGAANT
jgi:hypothetical protein